jgi:hypothetical protein
VTGLNDIAAIRYGIKPECGGNRRGAGGKEA